MAILRGLLGKSRRLYRIFEAMYHIWGGCASEYIWRDIVWALNFSTLDQFNCIDTNFVNKKSITKRSLALGINFFLFFMLIVLFVSPLKVPFVNAKDVQLRQRRESFCYFV